MMSGKSSNSAQKGTPKGHFSVQNAGFARAQQGTCPPVRSSGPNRDDQPAGHVLQVSRAEKLGTGRTPLRFFSHASALALLLLLPACSWFSKREVVEERPVEEKPTMNAAQAAASIGNPLLLNRGASDAVNYNVQTSEELAKIDNGAEGEVYFTNPDDPDAEIAGITAAFENRRHGNGWMDNYGRAVKIARRENRPVIIWFHDSVTSPKSRILGTNLLETPDFSEWCRDRVVRIKLDAGASIDERSSGSARYSMRGINAMASRYGLTRKPALVVISPNGKITTKIDGFDGFLAGVELELKSGVAEAEKEFEALRKTLEGRGYRTWHAARGTKTIFARLQRFDEARDVLYLREYGGRISRTPLARFSKEDVAWVDEHARASGGTTSRKGGSQP